ncbi:MAG: hypothetical protein AAF798_13600 [Bacteroidota bacterium]
MATKIDFNKFFTLSNIVALSALFVSVCSLYVSIKEVQTMNVQQSASIYPHLALQTHYNSEGFELRLVNNGVGLAKIESFTIHVEEDYFRNWLEIADYFFPDGHGISYSNMRANSIYKSVIPAGEKVVLVGLPWNDETRILQERAINDLELELCYSSLLGETWTLTQEENEPRASKCPPSSNIQFK